jgi:phospholipid/cholesterol/gamma-HCH transport system permease protein
VKSHVSSRRAPERAPSPTLEELIAGAGFFQRVKSASEMGSLALKTVGVAMTPPYPWIKDMVVQLSNALRRCLIPLFIAQSAYLISFGIILFGIILTNLGVVERQSGGIYLVWVREVCTWITGMIFAGVIGSAVTADLGARKIREELDALEVLGINQIRGLVVPRVLAMTIACPTTG